jgi:membrane protease YdiL (CAAX protease family)
VDDRPEALTRYRGLQIASIALAVGGLLLAATAVYLNLGILGSGTLADSSRAVGTLIAVVVGGVAFAVGLVMNAVRAVVVRAALPWWRYRGPSVIVLLILATILTSIASVAIIDEAAGLADGQGMSVAGAFVFLTITQLGMLAVAAAFVALPRALAGVRLVPERGVLRSVLLGLALAAPAWLVAQVLGVAAVLLLDALFGIEPAPGIADAAIARIDVGVVLVTLVVVAPVAEELFFRGVAYNAWKREYGAVTATLASAGLFALIHQSIFLALPIFVLGVVLARVYERTGSLPAVIALHAGFNAISVAIGLLVRFNVIQIS